jgi:serine/threonine protein kinase
MLQVGQHLDNYKIISFFAGGGMGEIYLAEEISLSRQVIIKVIRPEAIKYPNSQEARKVIQLFQREATAIARLNHPYILPLYRFGGATIDANPLMYMVMPYCQEKSLSDWMYTHGKVILSPQEVDHIIRQAAEALQYAHNQGIIHLDVKPSNFLVRYQTNDISKLNLQLTDFGIAKFAATTGMSQTVRGSLEYMAPEQWESQPVFATDQYALAIMIYRLLTGQSPFNGSGFEQLWHQHRFAQPLPPSTVNRSIPPSLDAVLLRALAKNPNDRYPTVIDFAEAYRQALQYRPTEYASIYQTLTLSLEEANRGTNRTLTLPSGEHLPVTIPPGVCQGQIITIPRQYAPMVIIAIQISAVSAPPPMPSIPYFSSSSSWNGTSPVSAPLFRRKSSLLILAGLILVMIIGIGVFLYNHYPNIQGTYSGSFQFSTGGTPTQMTLLITQQNQQRFEGTCTTVDSLFGTNTFTLEHGTVDRNGNIQFTFTGTNLAGTTLIRTFIGTSQSGGGWQGTFSDTGGNQGTWSVS